MNQNLHNSAQQSKIDQGRPLYAQQFGLQPADRIIEPIFQTGLSKHHSIYLGVDQYGQEWISENHKFYGVRLVKASEFFKGERSYTMEPFDGTYPDRIASVKRALSLLGKSYDLVNYNCEHYASFVQIGKVESKQVDNVMEVVKGLAITAAFIGLVNTILND